MQYTGGLRSDRGSVSATATSHAGEVLQGAVRRDGRTHRLLLSLPAPTLWSCALIVPTPGQQLTMAPEWAHKAYRGAMALLRVLRLPPPEVRIELTTNIPAGKGCGSSTADILATVRALLSWFDAEMEEEAIAALVVDVEEASDGSVLIRPSLFRHREGRVHEYLPGSFPEMDVLVFDTQPARSINTVSMERARYSAQEMETFEAMAGTLRRAFEEGNARYVGAIATQSARISQRFLPKPHFERLLRLVAEVNGYGLAVSHSGTAASVLLPVHAGPSVERRITRAVRGMGMEPVTGYTLSGGAQPEVHLHERRRPSPPAMSSHTRVSAGTHPQGVR